MDDTTVEDARVVSELNRAEHEEEGAYPELIEYESIVVLLQLSEPPHDPHTTVLSRFFLCMCTCPGRHGRALGASGNKPSRCVCSQR